MKSSVYIDSETLDTITRDLARGFSDKVLDLSVVYSDCLFVGSMVLLAVHSNSLDWLDTALYNARQLSDLYWDISSPSVDYDSDDIPFVNQGSDI